MPVIKKFRNQENKLLGKSHFKYFKEMVNFVIYSSDFSDIENSKVSLDLKQVSDNVSRFIHSCCGGRLKIRMC